jgi:cytochrome c biogenesis protein CcdA
LNDKQISKLLLAFEGIGAIFLGVFLLAYLMGVPSYVVYHSEPTFRMILSVFGGLLIILILIAFIASTLKKKKISKFRLRFTRVCN